jgi:hypothetical protein
MSNRVLARKAHRDGTSTIIRLVEDPAAKPRHRAMIEDVQRAVETVRARSRVKPAAPTEPAARRKVTNPIKRYTRTSPPGERVLGQPRQTTKAPAAPAAYTPDTSAIINLRRAFGLPVAAADVDRTRKAMLEEHRAAKARRKEAVTVEHSPPSTGDRTGATDRGILPDVFWAIHREWVAGGRRPVTVSAAEIAKLLGVSPEQVTAAVDTLWRTGQLQRWPVRGGGPVRYSPAL